MTCARARGVTDAFAEIRDALIGLATWAMGAADVLRVPVKQTKGTRLTDDQKTYNKLFCGVRGIGERANALFIARFKALRRVSLDPWPPHVTEKRLSVLLRSRGASSRIVRRLRMSFACTDTTFVEQCRLAWRNILSVAKDAGMTLDHPGTGHLAKVTVFLSDRRYREENALFGPRSSGTATRR